jgi:hypothetical protein
MPAGIGDLTCSSFQGAPKKIFVPVMTQRSDLEELAIAVEE